MQRLLALALLMLATPATAAERRVSVGSFDRIRVDGPFEVRVTTGGSPGGTISADAELIERIEARVEGMTMIVRMGSNGWGERPRVAATTPPVVTLTTPSLTAATVFGGARLSVTRMKGDRVDLTVSGAGTLALATADAAQLNASVIGTGAITAGGLAARARLLINGPGAIDAGALQTDQLVIRLDGPGETKAQARYSADVTNTGLGRVTVLGNAKCAVKSQGGGPVTCGPEL